MQSGKKSDLNDGQISRRVVYNVSKTTTLMETFWFAVVSISQNSARKEQW